MSVEPSGNVSGGRTGEVDPVGHPALTDPLTDLPNRLHFEAVFRIFFEIGDRGFPLVLLVLDVRAGREEEAPDDHLQHVATQLKSVSRRTDMVARIDGTRFGILLTDANLHGGRIVADRILETLPSADFPDLRAGIGLVGYHDDLAGRSAMMSAAKEAAEEALTTTDDPIHIVD